MSLQLALGCTDTATLGGLCVLNCNSMADASARDAVCPGADCDAATPMAADACAADGCSSDADVGPVCQPGSYELRRMNTDLLLVYDDSASLSPWLAPLDEGVRTFLSGTDPSGLRVGLQRFGEDCDPQTYATPVVQIGPLAENRMEILDALPVVASLTTSTLATLDGSLRYARAWSAAHSDGRVSVVLLSDASPGACDGLAGDYEGQAEEVARTAAAGSPSIRTFVVGVGPMPAVDSLAASGGTQAVRIAITPAAGEALAALEKVLQDARACAFQWNSGLTLAPDSAIAVTATDGTRRQYSILSDASACSGRDGFYVEDPDAPYPLLACPTTCVSLTAADRAALSSACSSPNKN